MAESASVRTNGNCEHLKKLIREVPDFPKKGILFYDITTLLKDKVGFATLIDALSEQYLGKETSTAFEHTTRTFNEELDRLQEELRRVDPTLAEALEKGRRKINYQIDGLRTRFNRAHVARDEAVHRQLQHAFDLLYPEKTLQERRINTISMIARHGRYVIDWIYDAID